MLVWLRTPVEGIRAWKILRIVTLPFAFMSNWSGAFADFQISRKNSPKNADDGGRKLRTMKIIKGILISVPLVFIYFLLFSSGDLVFRSALSGVGDWFASF